MKSKLHIHVLYLDNVEHVLYIYRYVVNTHTIMVCGGHSLLREGGMDIVLTTTIMYRSITG